MLYSNIQSNVLQGKLNQYLIESHNQTIQTFDIDDFLYI